MKAEDYTRVPIGLYLAWKASLATDYEDSFLCNRLCVTLALSGVYKNRRVLVRRTNNHYNNHTIG